MHCPTQKYNSKLKLGRGFTLEELKEAGIHRRLAPTIGITVDHRRTNKSAESLQLNVERLKEYKSRLIVFPRRNNKVKKGDATKSEIAAAKLDSSDVNALPKAGDAVSFTAITDVSTLIQSALRPHDFILFAISHHSLTNQIRKIFIFLLQELKEFKAYSSLRAARNDAKLVGIRAKKAKEGKGEEAPAKTAGDD